MKQLTEREAMAHAIQLAEKGRGFVEPNPMVGCILLKNNQLIGEGYHRKFGADHAEVDALTNCTESPEGATAIVTLEPCCHYGKTPPCAEALINAGIKRVVIGLTDPNPLVNGGGITMLQDAGVAVSTGLMSQTVAKQNAGFLSLTRRKQPWVIAKYAMTMDGNIATLSGDSKWISNSSCREKVHQLRSQVDAILVGSNTVLADDPQLTARPTKPAGPRQPLRIILDSRGSLPLTSKLVQTATVSPTLLVVSPECDSGHLMQLKNKGIEILELNAGYGERIQVLLNELGNRKITNLMVEGGSRVLGEFLSMDSIDEVQTYIAPRFIGSGLNPFSGIELPTIKEGWTSELEEVEQIENNIFIRSLIHTDLWSGLSD